MRKVFYDSQAYRTRQSLITKLNWQLGKLDILRKRIEKRCCRDGCTNIFYTIPADPKKYCSRNCAAKINNTKRKTSEITKKMISKALIGRPSPFKGIIKIERVKMLCQNPQCARQIIYERWKVRKYCSNKCAMSVIGGKATSPRAARAKAGIRSDLGDTYFYSRWEANFVRLLNFLGVKWIYQPEIFDLKSQKYTPDFYLPEFNLYVEIKNFLSDYSRQRDEKFRILYPKEDLILILKEDYYKLQDEFAKYIHNWEYS